MTPFKLAHLEKQMSFEVMVSHGFIEGAAIFNKFGRNPDVDTATTPEDMWGAGGMYTGFPDTTLETLSVSSTDVNDTAVGTGARAVRVSGLDANYSIQTETIPLNGTTPSSGTLLFRRVHTATVVSAGSAGVNLGLISITHTTTTSNVFINIQIGFNQSQNASFTIPAGHTGYMIDIHGAIRGGVNAVADGYIWTRNFGFPFRARRPFTIGVNSPLRDDVYGGLAFPEKSDLTLRVTLVTTNNIDIGAGYDLLLLKNL